MKLGQHFLINKEILNKISSYIDKRDIVLEIGAGYGNLTRYLLKAKKVYAVEIDSKLFKELRKVKNEKLVAINEDVLKLEIPDDVNKIVGNIPYEISSKITEKVLKFLKKGQTAILMYQKEFANRLVAKPCEKNYSRITILVRYLSHPKILMRVSKRNFKPMPKVDSTLVMLISNGKEYNKKFFEFIKLIFSHKRKKLKNAIYDSMKIKPEIGKIGEKRVNCLSLNDLVYIFNKLYF